MQKWKEEEITPGNGAVEPIVNVHSWLSRTTLDVIGDGKFNHSCYVPNIVDLHPHSRAWVSIWLFRQRQERAQRGIRWTLVSRMSGPARGDYTDGV